MRIESRRTVMARWLLSIFVSMMALSALHVHQASVSAATDCEECAHNVHHSGHFTTAAVGIHDCVLCQFFSLPFIPAAVIVIAVPLCLTITARRQDTYAVCHVAGSQQSPRAPPYI